jgi:hypothetical protein
LAESLASGCIPALVLPEVLHGQYIYDERNEGRLKWGVETLQPLIIPLKQSHSPSMLPNRELAHKLSYLRDDELEKMSRAGSQTARELFTTRTRVEGIWSALERWEDGGRGYLVSQVRQR